MPDALEIVDGLTFSNELKQVYCPNEEMKDRRGNAYRLPRYFFKVPDSQFALSTNLTAHFDLWEFLICDYKEHPVAARYPRYIPCGVVLIATALEAIRAEFNSYVHIAANGGYRSPSHQLSTHASPHCWGTAANIYRIADEYLEDEDKIEKYKRVAERALKSIWVRPYGHAVGQADDHLHLDLGHSLFVPSSLTVKSGAHEED
jgi:hypothetical protein